MGGPRGRIGAGLVVVLVLAALPAAAAPRTGAPPGSRLGSAPAGVERPAELDALLAALPVGSAAGAVVDGGVVEPMRSAREALLSVRDHRDTRAWLGSVAGAVTALTGLEPLGEAVDRPEHAGLAGQPEEDELAEDEDGWPVFEWAGSFADARAAGDLDGDGREDVLVIDYDLPTWDLQLRAVAGTDGAELWRQPYAGDGWLAFPLRRDLTGDGRPDVLSLRLATHLVRQASSESEGPFGWRYSEEWELDYTWAVEVLSGATGEQAWSRSLPGSLLERHEGESGLFGSSRSYEVDATNIWALGLPLDGEVLVEGLDLHVEDRSSSEGLLLVGSSESAYSVEGATRAELREGGTGALRGELESPRAPSFDLVWPAGDLTGDGREDLLWERYGLMGYQESCDHAVVLDVCEGEEVQPGLSFEAVDGGTLLPLWQRAEVATDGFAEPLRADLDGDGRDDLLLHVEEHGWAVHPVGTVVDEPADDDDDEEGWGSPSRRTMAVSGADGETRWASVDDSGGWVWPLATGDLGGSAGLDLLTATYRYDEAEESQVLRIDRIDGATGAVLSSSSLVPERPDTGDDEDRHGFAFPFAIALDDLDGDGAPEVSLGSVAGIWSWEEGEGEEDWWYVELTVEYTESSSRVESGRTTAVHHEEHHDGFALLLPLTDLTGDGIGDGVRLREGEGGSYTAFDYVARVDGWTREVDGWFFLLPGGDQEGTGVHSVLEHVDVRTDEGYSTTVTSVAGRSGTPRWQLRSEERG